MKQFVLQPAISKFQQKSYSLQPDMLTGWRSRLKLFRQIPIRFCYNPVDKIVKQYTKLGASKQYRIAYLGSRPCSNLNAIRNYANRQYDQFQKQSFVYSKKKLQKYTYKYLKQKEQYFSQNLTQHRIFQGMNPTFQTQQLIFDSDFQCGNLDLAVKIDQFSYDLFMRVDSNTRGHTCWFFFRIKNNNTTPLVHLNLSNFTKRNLLYRKGMYPYVCSKLKNNGWNHSCTDVTFQKRKLRYQVCEDISKQFHTLSFNYQFQFPFDEVYFAYCIPYSYSLLLDNIQGWKSAFPNTISLKPQQQTESPCGLKIPVLTITNSNVQKQKKIVLATGRIHPGQTQGSWTIHGFIKYLCSQTAKQLRDNFIFKVIPMLNVDGVVLGNFRTGLRGADINRSFKPESNHIQVQSLRELVQSLKQKILIYLDFHGHSSKKSAFIYGPEYMLSDTNYILSRLIPKIIGKNTQIFRYYGCIFKISKQKRTTARAVLFKQCKIPYCYTLQASAYSYTTPQGQILFSQQSYLKLGESTAKSILYFLQLIKKMDQRRQLKKRQKKQRKMSKIQGYQQLQEQQFLKSFATIDKQIKHNQGKTIMMEFLETSKNHAKTTRKFSDQLKQTKNNMSRSPQDFLLDLIDDSDFKDLIKQINLDVQVTHNSEGSSDYETQNEDYTKEEQQQFFNQQKKKEFIQTKFFLEKKNPQSQQIKKYNNSTHRQLKNQSVKLPSNQKQDKQKIKMIQKKTTLYNHSLQKNNISSDQILPQLKKAKQVQVQIQRRSKIKHISEKPKEKQKQKVQDNNNISYPQKQKQYQLPEKIQKSQDQTIVIKHGGIVTIRMDTKNSQYIQKQQSNRKKGRSRSQLPEIYRKNDFQKKRLQIIKNQKIQIPNLVSQLVKEHMKKKRQNLPSRFNNIIQVIRL